MPESQDKNHQISVKKAAENNLRHVSVSIPHQSFTVITGVSGSGKSSLAYHVIFKEAQRRFLSSFSSFSRLHTAKMEKPHVLEISGLQAAVALKQQAGSFGSSSTVGTLSGVADYLRLLFARMGTASCVVCQHSFKNKEERSCTACGHERPQQLAALFSFNSYHGACPDCKGLGLSEQIDVNKLIADPSLSLRQGALVPTTPTGYIVYSQVTVDALNEVCKAHGFDVDTPWQALSSAQQDVILYGSDKVKVLFGKHALESRLKWKGITARPRVEGYYKGMIPIMEEILRRDRNDNILRFASSFPCKSCHGTRLSKEALAVTIGGFTIADLLCLSIDSLEKQLTNIRLSIKQTAVYDAILEKAFLRLNYLKTLGLGYLTLDRASATLSGGEAQRISLAAQTGSGLQGVLYVLDEPSAGLHPYDNQKLIAMLKTLRSKGNTVLVVEHDEDTIRSADHLIDIGPGAGSEGGTVIFEGKPEALLLNAEQYPGSKTAQMLSLPYQVKTSVRKAIGTIEINGASLHNLKQIDVQFKMGALNVITGLSGAGKSTLLHGVLADSIRKGEATACNTIKYTLRPDRLIEVDQSPIGRTSRSNPATYSGLFDVIRALLARQPESLKRGFKKGQFSFNTPGGRCEHCNGSGLVQLGMHFLGDVETQCEKCDGKRFTDETLKVTYKGKNIFEILELTFEEAGSFFEDIPQAKAIIDQFIRLGIAYLKLGQPSPSLSGGEAQRVKLAGELHKKSKGHALYMLDEPTLGLHKADVQALLSSLSDLVDQGNTVVVIEHDPEVIFNADHIVDLGPEGGEQGGELIFAGTPKALMNQNKSLTALALQKITTNNISKKETDAGKLQAEAYIQLEGVDTHNLKNLSVKIPHRKTTVITGVSGSGKTALAFDTLFAECRNRFTESYTSYARRMLSKIKRPELEQGSGFSPAIAIRQSNFQHDSRSTVGTMTGLSENYRLLFSRIGKINGVKQANYTAAMFSFNHEKGACEACNGMGVKVFADPAKFVTNPEKPLTAGALDGTKPGRFFGEADGQYVHTLRMVGQRKGINFDLPFNRLDASARKIALYGCGEEMFSVDWQFKRAGRSGSHQLNTVWQGFANLILFDYQIKQKGKRGEAFAGIISEKECESCGGSRLSQEILSVKINGLSVAEVSAMDIRTAQEFFMQLPKQLTGIDQKAAETINSQLQPKLRVLEQLGLSYLSADRSAKSLSGGEARRVRMASQLEAGLCGITYVIDEPTTGLHPRDTKQLLDVLDRLKALGNTMVFVEHDPEVIKHADNIIELGPGAGSYGGKLVFEGSFDAFQKSEQSITKPYFNQKPALTGKAIAIEKPLIYIKAAEANNLKQLDIAFPSAQMIAVTGVSGSGKSSLVFDVLASSFEAGKAVNCQTVSFGNIAHLVSADQHQLHSSSVSTIASASGIYEPIRDLLAQLPESKALGLKKQHFSLNASEGCCNHCKGLGKIKVSLDFLSDVYVNCEVCEGKRFKTEVLSVKLKGMSVHDILELEVSQASEFFGDHKKLKQKLSVLSQVGLGYLKLGQTTNTLSGGEAQRLKLAREILKENRQNTSYIFDEPTSGLHFKDIEHLLKLFKRLVDEGHTVIVVEHNLQMIAAADWLIDLGPEGGPAGGEIIYNGPLSDCLSTKNSSTIQSLIAYLG